MTEQTEPVQVHGKLWSLLDWSFWGAGMGDTFREPLADAMLAAVPAETIAQAEQIMAEFLERRNIEKTGVTIYQEQRDELDQARTRIAEAEAQLAEMTRCRDNALRALYRDDVETDPHLPDLFADGLHGLYEWDDQPEPDQAPQELVDRCVRIVRPAFGKLAQQRDKARQRAREHGELAARRESELLTLRPRVAELKAELKKYVGAEPTIAQEMAYLSACFHAVHDLCNEQEKAARLFEFPTPEWVTAVRAAASGERTSYPPALPWAALMDDEDLADFLAELEHAIATPGATPDEALTEVEEACGTWRLIAETQHAHNTAPGPDTEAEGR